MAGEVLRRAVHDDVGSVLQRPQQRRREEGVVDDQLGAVAVGQFREGGQVDDSQQGIGEALGEDGPGLGRDRRLDRRQIGAVDQVDRRAEVRQVLEQNSLVTA